LETIYFDGAVSFCFEILTFSAKKSVLFRLKKAGQTLPKMAFEIPHNLVLLNGNYYFETNRPFS
jgi:hypothetical protein